MLNLKGDKTKSGQIWIAYIFPSVAVRKAQNGSRLSLSFVFHKFQKLLNSVLWFAKEGPWKQGMFFWFWHNFEGFNSIILAVWKPIPAKAAKIDVLNNSVD